MKEGLSDLIYFNISFWDRYYIYSRNTDLC